MELIDFAALYERANENAPDGETTHAPAAPAATSVAIAALVIPSVPVRAKCTAHNAETGEPCKNWPIRGATVCVAHGGKAPQVKAAAARRVEAEQALALARKAAGDVDLAVFGDPFTALETALAHQHALALRLLALVEQIPDDQLRYRGKMAEQLRGEVSAAQAALRDLKASAEGAMRLGLAERRAKISEAKVDIMEHALLVALAATGLGLDGQAKAREVLRAELGRGVHVVPGAVEEQ